MTEILQRRNLLIYLALAAAIAMAYSPVRHFGFTTFDDSLYITGNPEVQNGLTFRSVAWAFTTHHAGNWHPLTWVSHMLDWQLWGGNGGAHHLVNAFLHLANTLLLFGVLNRITGAPWRSACVAALFALHPLHVESVVWVAERKDVLSAFFWILTLWGYVRYTEEFTVRGSRWKSFYGLTLLCFTLGLMSKPMVVTLPLVLLLLDYWPLGRTPWAKPAVGKDVKTPPSRLLREKLPFFALAAASCVATLWAQRAAGAVMSLEKLPLGPRVTNALLSYVGYLGKAFWPTGLAVFYPLFTNLSPAAAMVAGVGLLGVTTAVIWRARRAPWLATGWFWYLGTLVPVIGLVQVGSQSMADRYTYVALVGLFLMLCWSVPSRAMERPIMKVTICVAAVAALVVCAVLTRIQVGYWKDTETLFRHALDVTRGNWVAHYNLGIALERTGEIQEAIGHYEQAVRLEPDYAEAHYNLGALLEQAGRVQEAIEHDRQALRIRPDYAKAHNNLGVALARLGKGQEAISQFEQALRVSTDYAEAHNNLGAALAQVGRFQEAIEQFDLTLRITPDDAEAHCNLGIALERVGRFEDAIRHYEQALRLKPDYPEAHNHLGVALARAGSLEKAIGHFEEALRIKSDYLGAHYNLGVALEQTGRPKEAIEHYEQALRIKPDYVEAREALARLRAAQ